MSDLTWEPITTSYSIKIGVEPMLALMCYESRQNEDLGEIPFLYELLDDVCGVSSVDYNGHFGDRVYLTLETTADTLEMRARLTEIISERLADAAAFGRSTHA